MNENFSMKDYYQNIGNILFMLNHLYYDSKFYNWQNIYRHAGALEFLLCVEGKIVWDKPVPYGNISYKNFFGRQRVRKENYVEAIIRLTRELLQENEH